MIPHLIISALVAFTLAFVAVTIADFMGDE